MLRCMRMQQTIRNISPEIDEALRRRAQEEGKSLNQVAKEALARGLGVKEPDKEWDLSWIAGTWVEDPEFDKAIAEFEQIDPEDWE